MKTYSLRGAEIARWTFCAAILCVMATIPYSARGQAAPAPLGGARVTGKVTDLVGQTLRVTLRDGRTVAVNLHAARAHGMVPMMYNGEFVRVQGKMTGHGTMTAVAVTRAKSAPALWSKDIP